MHPCSSTCACPPALQRLFSYTPAHLTSSLEWGDNSAYLRNDAALHLTLRSLALGRDRVNLICAQQEAGRGAMNAGAAPLLWPKSRSGCSWQHGLVRCQGTGVGWPGLFALQPAPSLVGLGRPWVMRIGRGRWAPTNEYDAGCQVGCLLEQCPQLGLALACQRLSSIEDNTQLTKQDGRLKRAWRRGEEGGER